MEKNHVIKLDCDTAGSTMYYTLDGSAPELHRMVAPKVSIPFVEAIGGDYYFHFSIFCSAWRIIPISYLSVNVSILQ